MDFKTFKYSCYSLLLLSIYNLIVFEPNQSAGLIFISLFIINVFCFSFWHHDLYLNTLFCLLVYFWFLFPDLTFYHFSLFEFLILLQITFAYLITVIHKFNIQFLNSTLLIEKIQITKIKVFFLKKNPTCFNISIILIECFLSLIIFFYNNDFFFLYLIIGVIFHFTIYLLTGLGRTYHLLFPSFYILIVPLDFQYLYLFALSPLFGFYFCKLFLHNFIKRLIKCHF
mgnify:CR=1 FL=1